MYQNWIKKGSKNIKKAEEKYQKALEICERRADEDLMGMGSQLADVLLSYAELKERQGKKTESFDMRKRAFDIYEQMTKKSPGSGYLLSNCPVSPTTSQPERRSS